MVSKDHFPQPSMDQKPKPPPKRTINNNTTATTKSYFCLPRFRTTTTNTTTHNHPRSRFSPAISLLDRLREAVFRLIMLSALSSSTKSTTKQQPDKASAADRHDDRRENRHRSHYPSESHYSEAVADCIEFIKKSSVTAADASRDSSACSARSSTVDAASYVMY